jgi:hypothetical protein
MFDALGAPDSPSQRSLSWAAAAQGFTAGWCYCRVRAGQSVQNTRTSMMRGGRGSLLKAVLGPEENRHSIDIFWNSVRQSSNMIKCIDIWNWLIFKFVWIRISKQKNSPTINGIVLTCSLSAAHTHNFICLSLASKSPIDVPTQISADKAYQANYL